MDSETIKSYCSLPIKVIMDYGNSFPCDVYLKLSENKIIKLSNKEEDVKETFLKYYKKGVEAVYVREVKDMQTDISADNIIKLADCGVPIDYFGELYKHFDSDAIIDLHKAKIDHNRARIIKTELDVEEDIVMGLIKSKKRIETVLGEYA